MDAIKQNTVCVEDLASMTGRDIIQEEGIMEQISWRRHYGGGIMEMAPSGKHHGIRNSKNDD